MKIINYKKFVRSITILIILSSISMIIGLNTSYSTGETKYIEEYISNGDTLWNIAKNQSQNNKYYENKDIRDIIQEIKVVNNLNNANISEGQKLLIPTI